MVKLGAGGMGEGGMAQICGFPHPFRGLAALPASQLGAPSMVSWGHTIHWGASSARAWGGAAIPERGVVGWGKGLWDVQRRTSGMREKS